MANRRDYVHFLDLSQEVNVVERRLPHWSQPSVLSFITFRTWDSMPEDVLRVWLAEREEFLRHQQSGIPTRAQPSSGQAILSERWNANLDASHGACVLRHPDLARIVADSLEHFDGERYVLTDYVVMPNHVHVLAAFPDESIMLRQCESWKHFTATTINRRLGRSGRFWQQDGFDHLVRSPEQFEQLRCYLAENPRKARLQAGEYLHESKDLFAELRLRSE